MSTYLVEELCSLTQDVPCLYQLPQTLAEELVALVHLRQARLMLRQLHVEFVDGLRRTWSDRDERGGVVQRAHGDGFLLLLELTRKEAHSAGHLVNAANFAHVGTLERIDIRVQLLVG